MELAEEIGVESKIGSCPGHATERVDARDFLARTLSPTAVLKYLVAG